jgi:hypothetical protein
MSSTILRMFTKSARANILTHATHERQKFVGSSRTAGSLLNRGLASNSRGPLGHFLDTFTATEGRKTRVTNSPKETILKPIA